MAGEVYYLLIVIALEQWTAASLLLPCSCKMWLTACLPAFSPAPGQDFTTWGLAGFKADLAWISQLSFMYVYCWWGRKEKGMDAGCDERLPNCPISAHHVESYFPPRPLYYMQVWKLGSHTLDGFIFFSPLHSCLLWNVKHSGDLSNKYETGVAATSLDWLAAIHPSLIHSIIE